ncbi:MAG: terminase small subunit [Firmicutes bacterium]|nr:terminase small subunit [Bacillota bacterium]
MAAKGELTEKQKRFIEEYLALGDAAKAARAAGYSRRTASRIGHENLTKPRIREALQARLDALQDARVAKANEVLEYLTSVMRGESQAEIVVVEGMGEGISEARHVRKAPEEKERLRAAELLGKRMRLWDGEQGGSEPVQVIIDV